MGDDTVGVWLGLDLIFGRVECSWHESHRKETRPSLSQYISLKHLTMPENAPLLIFRIIRSSKDVPNLAT